VLLADGGAAIADLAVLRQQPGLFGLVASDATAWQVLDAIDELAFGSARPKRTVPRTDPEPA
jgi:glycine cleavage system aminomethyltransferase T